MMDGLTFPRSLGASSDIGTFAERPEPQWFDALSTLPQGWEMIDVRGKNLFPVGHCLQDPAAQDSSDFPAERGTVESFCRWAEQ